ncbi:uncharacterized protein LOC111032416 isoform X1 [Myzus persicae]|uniref:uncharacterized protein LOC111032416 isoform X1 n=2 Tax=Myzus persicae TaxID=13164 RepID=UPI000B9323E5|nr:uncharacterized protein LOC111032416 isoform X1 [Myzus persicae]XP_022168420.1 uncharacterized protein LOC111032416 isoform X1 [Myzus persicae]XP_022168422.1 uncharacterized protein LOC111032416 isoform X1 [Myzus persicae]XP_022168423.1 uncharacterized protein LOC111032416 isoform X1 [Myzus persicae]XP_022168424.1 uncharacterized protein LOC111032416 isoform X1 [Myzus persicae]XP_022168425.1 uncharacterized protein LOC111032416 isoform X1 [Myzus persicae]XP_022168426.1 uncharacterized prot
MSVNVGLEDSYQNSHNGAFQSCRPIKALMMYVQRRNSIMGNEPCDNNIRMPSSSWSDSTSQNIHLKLTCQETYLKDTTTWSDMQYEAEDTVSEIKYYYPKKRFLEKAEMEADQIDTAERNLSSQNHSPTNHLGVSTKCLKETILQCRNAFKDDPKKPNTEASEFLQRTFGDVTKNNNLDTEENMNLCVQTAQDQKTEPYYRSGYKKFTLRRNEEDSNDSNVIETPTVIEQLPVNLIEQIEVNEPRGRINRACKGVRYQQFMNDTLSKRQNKKMGPKKLVSTDDTVTKRRKGKKCNIKEENNQAPEISSLPIQSRRETRNSAKAAALRKLKENTDEIIEDNKRKQISDDITKELDSTSIMVVPKKRFRTNENDNKCETAEEPKRLPSPISSEASSSRLSSPESSTSSTSTHVHYKKRVSRTFAESQNNTNPTSSDTNVNLQTLADVALRGIPF